MYGACENRFRLAPQLDKDGGCVGGESTIQVGSGTEHTGALTCTEPGSKGAHRVEYLGRRILVA